MAIATLSDFGRTLTSNGRGTDHAWGGNHVVMGGEVRDPRGSAFVDLEKIDVRGIFPTYGDAFNVWRGAAQETVDNAFIKYMIVRLR